MLLSCLRTWVSMHSPTLAFLNAKDASKGVCLSFSCSSRNMSVTRSVSKCLISECELIAHLMLGKYQVHALWNQVFFCLSGTEM